MGSQAAAVSVDTSPNATLITRIPDPAFETRWNAWVARGAEHDLAGRRKARFFAGAALAVIAIMIGFRLLGGSL